VVQSFEPGEAWRWCYVDGVFAGPEDRDERDVSDAPVP
jgi:hypothetical protein